MFGYIPFGSAPVGPARRTRGRVAVAGGPPELGRRVHTARTHTVDSEREARDVEALLRNFEIVPMAGDAIAVAAARNFRLLRRRGVTVRKTIDLLIGTWCIETHAGPAQS